VGSSDRLTARDKRLLSLLERIGDCPGSGERRRRWNQRYGALVVVAAARLYSVGQRRPAVAGARSAPRRTRRRVRSSRGSPGRPSADDGPEPPLVRQARERAVAARVRAEGLRVLDAWLPLFDPVAYVDGRVADFARAAGIHERNARRWLQRFHELGILVWIRKAGRGAIGRLALRVHALTKNARISGAPRVRALKGEALNPKSEEQNLRATPCHRASLSRRTIRDSPPPGWRSLEELIESTDERTLETAYEIVDVLDNADEGTLRTVLGVLDRGGLGEPALSYAFDHTVTCGGRRREPDNDAGYLVGVLQNIAAGCARVPDEYFELFGEAA
jgi:hypothetical protein